MRLVILAGALLAAAALAAPAPAAAQLRGGGLAPRAEVDSSFAVGLEVSHLAEMLRRGAVDARRFPNSGLEVPARQLAEAAGRRRRPRPNPALSPAWDLQVKVVEIERQGPDRLVATTHVYLDTDGPDATPVRLFFRRAPQGWALERNEGLAERLAALTGRLARGGAR